MLVALHVRWEEAVESPPVTGATAQRLLIPPRDLPHLPASKVHLHFNFQVKQITIRICCAETAISGDPTCVALRRGGIEPGTMREETSAFWLQSCSADNASSEIFRII